jgi:hypothetical protein
MPKSELPQRDPFMGPPSAYVGETDTELLEAFETALRRWANPLAPTETSRWRGEGPSATGRTAPLPTQMEV